MKIRSLNKADLNEYIHSENFGKGEHLPISYHRAISHINNPRIGPNDYILFLAEEEDQLAGYLGVLPDLLFAPNQPIIKIGWLSCIWVNIKYRGKGIPKQLFTEAHFRYKNYILGADYVPATKKMYTNIGFYAKEPLVKDGIRLYIKSDLQTILPPKKEVFKTIRPLLQVADSVLNLFTAVRSKLISFPLGNMKLESIDRIDEKLEQFISKNSTGNYFQRTTREFHWIKDFPWILSTQKVDLLNSKYYFSSVTKEFKNEWIQVVDSNRKIVAVFFFTVRDGSVKLPYFFSETSIESCTNIVQHLLQKWNAKTFTVFNPELLAALKVNQKLAIHKKHITREYVLDKTLSKLITDANYCMADGEGDSAFT